MNNWENFKEDVRWIEDFQDTDDLRLADATGTQVQLTVPDHEVLIAFNNDADAEVFRSWWEYIGHAQFINDCQKSIDEIAEERA